MECEYTEKLPKYGHLIPVDEFKEDVENQCFLDFDGSGQCVKDGLMCRKCTIKPSRVNEIPEDATHIMWYNE